MKIIALILFVSLAPLGAAADVMITKVAHAPDYLVQFCPKATMEGCGAEVSVSPKVIKLIRRRVHRLAWQRLLGLFATMNEPAMMMPPRVMMHGYDLYNGVGKALDELFKAEAGTVRVDEAQDGGPEVRQLIEKFISKPVPVS